jgi:flagellar capping protein FliD
VYLIYTDTHTPPETMTTLTDIGISTTARGELAISGEGEVY